MSSRLRGVSVGWLCCWLLSVTACDRSGDSHPTPPKPSASAAKPHRVVLSCSAAKKGAYYTLGDSGPSSAKLVDAGSDDVELPFAVEVGSAEPYRGGFVISALTNQGEGSAASVAIVSSDASEGRVVALGEVHGDVVPPRIAVQGDHLIAALVDNDAGSQTLRLLELQPSAPEPVVARGPDFSQGRDDSSAFDLAFSNKRGLLVWDRYDKARGHVVLEASSFVAGDVAGASQPRMLSPDGDDAEMPRLVSRPGGFWLTYVAHGPPAPEPSDAADADVDNLADMTPRRLTILPLDAAGVPGGEPRRLTGEGSHVLAYDVARHGAGALLAWRDDPTTLGVEAPVVHVAQVRPDGTFETRLVEDPEFGAGAPALLTEASPGKQKSWLGVMGSDQTLRLATLVDGPKPGAPAPLPAELRLAEAMTRSGAALLLARPRGRVVDLSVVRCEER